MKLQLERPLVFFDLETTGVDVSSDRVVEISMVKLFPDSHKESLTYRVNPERHIPEGASAVHHIYDEDVKDCPTFKQLANVVLAYIQGCDLAGYNSNHFDVPMLQEELLRAGLSFDLKKECKMVDAFVIFQKHTPRNLTAAYMHYCGKVLEGAHGANADTEATYEVLMAQVEQHSDVPCTIAELSEYTTQQQWADLAGKLGVNEAGEPTFNFGKNKGRTLREVFTEPNGSGYYSWFMAGEFPLYTKQICTDVMNAIKNERKEEKRAKEEAQRAKDEAEKTPATEDMLLALAAKVNAGKPNNKKKIDDGQMSLF